MELNVNYFKKELEDEAKRLEDELKSVGAKKNPDNPDDWEATVEDVPTMTADKNEMADRLENFEQSRSTEVTLELRLNNVKKALEKIENNTYGVCEECGETISEERLKANPAATTCVKHME